MAATSYTARSKAIYDPPIRGRMNKPRIGMAGATRMGRRGTAGVVSPQRAAARAARSKSAPTRIVKRQPSDPLAQVGQAIGGIGKGIGDLFSHNPIDQLYRSIGERIQGATRKR